MAFAVPIFKKKLDDKKVIYFTWPYVVYVNISKQISKSSQKHGFNAYTVVIGCADSKYDIVNNM